MLTKDRIVRILAALDRARQKRPEMFGLLDMQEELVRAQSIIGITDFPVEMGAENTWIGRWLEGLPAMTWEKLNINWGSFHFLLDQAAEIIARHHPEMSEIALSLSTEGWESRQALAQSWYAGEELDAVTAGIIAVAAQPWLVRASEVIAPSLNSDLWRRGTCPVCGGLPDLALIEERSGARSLCCARCDARWDYARLGCPFCRNDDPSTLAYYTGDNGPYRLYVCEACHGYLKAIDLRQANRSVEPCVERILTLPLDALAQGKGYVLPKAC